MSRLSQEVINQIQNIKKLPYELSINDNHGASEDIYWKGTLLLKKGSTTNCVCFVTELVVRALKELGFEDRLSFDLMRRFQKHSFIVDEDENFWGMPEAIVDLGLGYEIDINDLSSFKRGEVGQYWMLNNKDENSGGHAVIILGIQEVKGRSVFQTYNSSNIKPEGHYETWHNIELKRDNGYERVWMVSRLDEEVIKQNYPKL